MHISPAKESSDYEEGTRCRYTAAMSKSFRRPPQKLFLWLTLLLLIGTIAIAGVTAQVEQEQQIRGGNGITLPSSPGTTLKPVTDDYLGTSIVDNYRWLEDAKSEETRAWIDEENSFTHQYLSQVSLRPQMVRRLTQLQRVDVSDIPLLRGQKYFFAKRLADENQASIYLCDGWKGNDERLVDATRLSTDQNSSLSIQDVSDDGRLLGYGVRQGGADEESLHFLDEGPLAKSLSIHYPLRFISRLASAPTTKAFIIPD